MVREQALGEGWEPFVRVARDVAVAGVPPEAPGRAVLCLVAGMVAVRGTPQGAAGELARQLMSVTGYFRCWDCERMWTIADGLAENPDGARPQHHPAEVWTESDGSAATVESAAAGGTGEAATRFRQDGNAVIAADGTPWGRISVFADSTPGSSGVSAHWRWCPVPVGRRSWPAPGTRAWCACGTWPTADSSMIRCPDILTVSAR